LERLVNDIRSGLPGDRSPHQRALFRASLRIHDLRSLPLNPAF